MFHTSFNHRVRPHCHLAAITLSLAAFSNGLPVLSAKPQSPDWVQRVAGLSHPLPFSMTFGGRAIRRGCTLITYKRVPGQTLRRDL